MLEGMLKVLPLGSDGLQVRPSSLLVSAVVLTFLYIGWRLWRFTIFPVLYPEEPRQLPYLIPYVGHTIAFARCSENVYRRGNEYFPGDELYALTIAGGTTVIVRSPSDIATVWKNTTTLSYDGFTERMLAAFGISSESLVKMYTPNPRVLIVDEKQRKQSALCNANPKNKAYIHLQSDWFRTQLLPGEHLDYLQETYLVFLNRFLKFDRFDDHFVVNEPLVVTQEAKSAVKVVSLSKFCRYIISRSSFRTFFGEELFEAEPELARIYQTWEDQSWKVFFNYPPWLAPELHQCRMKFLSGMMKYLEMPESKRTGMVWLFRMANAELQTLGWKDVDRAGLLMMISWAINNNAHFIAFWMFSHLFANPALLKTVREETDACCTDDGACDLNKLVSDCPHLQAVWQESLRFYNAGTTVRKATGDCNIGGKHIHDGDQIFGPIRNFALRQDFFGGDSHEFNAYRWLQNPNLVRSKGYLPFGGGHTYCPGRYFAQREIFMFIALTLRRFDIRVTTAEGIPVERPKAPPIRVDVPSPAAIAPNEDVFITMSERQL